MTAEPRPGVGGVLSRMLAATSRIIRHSGDLGRSEFSEVVSAVRDILSMTEDMLSQRLAQGLLEEYCAEDNRFAAIGEIAASVAHDINNISTAILGNVQFLSAESKDSEAVSEIRDAVSRATALCASVMGFAGGRPVGRDDLGEIVSACARLVDHYALKHRVKIALDLPPERLRVRAPGVEQVVVNLMINAVQAMPSGGTMTVSLSAGPGTAACVVSDTGVGIAQKNLEDVFHPFYTTRENFGGHGLGLSICKRIVERSGGTLAAESDGPGKGARFTATVPLLGGAP